MHRLLPALALSALALAAYSNSLGGEFVLDSKGLIAQDARVQAATAENVDLILNRTYWWPYGESGLYRPATTLSYLLNFAVLGNETRPAGYHWINTLLHVANILFVYLLAVRLIREERVAWFVAAVWAVHPVLTESVTNIAGRADLLAATAVLGGVLLYLESREAAGWRRVAWLAGLAAATTLGVFSKESAVVVVGVIALYEIAWWSDQRSIASLKLACVAVLPPLVVMWLQRSAVLAAAGQATFPYTDNPIIGADFWVGRLTAISVMGRYLWLMVWPATLSADYSYAAIPLARGSGADWLAWVAVVLAAALAAGAFWRSRRVFFFAALAFGSFLPTSNIVIAIGSIMAERFLYLPSVGIVACFVLAVFAGARLVNLKMLAPIALGVVIVALGARTVVRNADWRDDVTLGTATVQANPASYKGHKMLAEALYDSDPSHDNIDDVIAEAAQAVAVIDSLPDALNAGAMYLDAGGYYLEQGERLRLASATDAAATLTADQRRPYEQAVSLLRRAEAIGDAQRQARADERFSPAFAQVYRRLSIAYMRLGDSRQSLDTAVRARDLTPVDPDVHVRLAEALLAVNRPDDAAIALTGGVMTTGSQALAQALLSMYGAGLDPDGCAMLGSGATATLNPRCPIVRRHLCAATAETLTSLLQAGRRDLAERRKATAIAQFGCAAAPLDAVLPPG